MLNDLDEDWNCKCLVYSAPFTPGIISVRSILKIYKKYQSGKQKLMHYDLGRCIIGHVNEQQAQGDLHNYSKIIGSRNETSRHLYLSTLHLSEQKVTNQIFLPLPRAPRNNLVFVSNLYLYW